MSHSPGVSGEQPATAFESFVRVRFHEVDGLGHVNNAAYLNYLEQAAIDHAVSLGIDMESLQTLGGVFLARRHDILFQRPAYAGDLLRVVTWLGEARGARVERHYRIFREPEPMAMVPSVGRVVNEMAQERPDSLVVRATTEWIFASVEGRPKRIPVEIARRFQG